MHDESRLKVRRSAKRVLTTPDSLHEHLAATFSGVEFLLASSSSTLHLVLSEVYRQPTHYGNACKSIRTSASYDIEKKDLVSGRLPKYSLTCDICSFCVTTKFPLGLANTMITSSSSARGLWSISGLQEDVILEINEGKVVVPSCDRASFKTWY